MAEKIDVERFHQRLTKLHKHFVKHNAAVWNSADCLLLHRGPVTDEDAYQKSTVLHQWLFRYELVDTMLGLTKDGRVWVCGTKRKCEFIQPAVEKLPMGIKSITLLQKNKQDENAANYETLWNDVVMAARVNGEKKTVGVILKERERNLGKGILGPWEERLTKEAETNKSIDLVDVGAGLGFAMCVKDEDELDLMKKSSVLTNKVMKHGCVKRLEKIMDSDESITHEELANYIESILEDPSEISLQVPTSDAGSCYNPIVQTGGSYDLRVSAQSSSAKLRNDIIMVSLGARYKNYCSNMSRTFLVDPPKKVSSTYEILLEMQEACLSVMKAGTQLKKVYLAAVEYLKSSSKSAYLVDHLPKNLGFCMGIDFRESTLLLSPKNSAAFKKGMVFCLSVGFQDLELPEEDRSASPDKSPIKTLSKYALVISDMVAVTSSTPDIMTKMGRNLSDVTYLVNEEGGDDDDDDDDDESEASGKAPAAPKGDAALARKMAKKNSGTRTSSRLARDTVAQADATDGAREREKKQIALMKRRNETRVRELAKLDRNRGDGDGKNKVEELETYRRTSDYPEVNPNQVRVDMASQCVILPICGNPIPFHISTIKNIVMPEDDTATLLRLNFYSAGQAVGKEASESMAKLVAKYAPYASFVREMTFRSLKGDNLKRAFRQLSELRKRARQRELQQQQEASLVEQEKLIRTKNERVPRILDVTLRPVITNRKTQGNVEAHTNGLRFISTRNEVLDIMYQNIKYAIFQPCENEIMVLLHFHLRNPIMIGKKKHMDVQFFTEVVDASQAVDNSRRSMYDPDEMDDEQRERQLRKKLNHAFRDFCKKVDSVAKKHGYTLEFDIPYRALGFTGNPHKEMVSIFPTLNCLVNLTETPFFVVDLSQVDHVHFERVTYMSKAFDIVLVNKDFSKQPWRVDMIPNADKETVSEWLTDMELTYTEGPMNLNWKHVMSTVKDDERFYMDTEEDEVTEKDAGWEFLRMYGKDDSEAEQEEEDDSEFSEANDREEPSDDESEVADMDSEDDEDDYDGDEDLEEQGMDWDEMEEEAAISDKRKRQMGEEEEEAPRKQRRGNGNKRRR